jgi:hypothetical protein
MHESDPILMIYIVRLKYQRHPGHIVYEIIHILYLHHLKWGIGLRGIDRTRESFGCSELLFI